MRLKFLPLLTTLLFFLCPIALTAQEAVPADSVPASPFEQAVQALKAGDYDTPRAYLESLGKKERNRFEQKMLSLGLAIARFDTEGAHEIIDGIKPKQITDPELFDRLSTLLQREERMLQSALSVELVGTPKKGALDALKSELSALAKPVGELSEKAFTAAGGQVRWEVIRREDGRETFGIVYRLGDGTWDDKHTEEVTVLGLDSLGRYAYPFLLSDGETLYFSYSGPETLGGWDIYLSRYNAEEHTLLVPQQLPMPVNSPADDYGFLLDESTGTGAFITERDTPEGEGTLVKYRPLKDGILPSEKDSLAGYALLRNLPATPDEKLFGEMPLTASKATKEPLFWIKGQAIYGADDLMKAGSRVIFDRFLAVSESFRSEKARLERLRDEFGRNTAAKASISSEILALEKALRAKREELKALRNEVIKSETR